MSQHIVPVKTYVGVFVALLILLALTVAAAQIEHGPINLVVGLSIAVAKAALIVLFFMHLRYDPFVVWTAALAGVLWLAILMALTMGDYISREPSTTAGDANQPEATSWNDRGYP